jgi:oxygen-independent coproporphyrinogen-3 oxidase
MHRSKDIWESLVMLQEVYGSDLNYSLDLISGLPGLSLAQWTDTLNTAVHLQPQPAHLSLYDLQIEGGTVFGKWYDSDKDASERSDFKRTRGQPPVSALILPSEENCAFMYKYAAGYLRSKGYEHYEVSSYALTGDTGSPSPRRSQHNQIYWETDSQWYALGLGATSFTSGVMKARPKTLVDYVRWVEVEASSLHDIAPIEDYELLTDVVLKRLRTSEGLKLKWVARRFAKGDAYVELILRGAQLGLELDLVKLEDNVLRLADPTGFLYSNTIISSIFAELEAADTHR